MTFSFPQLCLAVLLLCAGAGLRGQQPPPIPENVSRADYLKDVGRAAQLAIHEAEIGFKYNNHKITAEAYYSDFTPTRKEINALRAKWGQVSPKMGVQFVADYRQRSDNQISALKSQYAPKPVVPKQPREVYRGEPEPQREPAIPRGTPAGDDVYVVDNASDYVYENSASGTDSVLSSISHTLESYVENLTLTGSGSINGTGNWLDNILIGNSGVNTLTGSTGADTFMFKLATAFSNVDTISDFNTGQSDVLDVRDLLNGYDPGTDVITNWVRITDSGSDSIVEVDRDGTGGTYGWSQIATLTGVTGLTDEAALVTSGNLLAA